MLCNETAQEYSKILHCPATLDIDTAHCNFAHKPTIRVIVECTSRVVLQVLQSKLWQPELEHPDVITLPIRMELGLCHLHASSISPRQSNAAMHTHMCSDTKKDFGKCHGISRYTSMPGHR